MSTKKQSLCPAKTLKVTNASLMPQLTRQHLIK